MSSETVLQKLANLQLLQDEESAQLDADRKELDRLLSITQKRDEETQARKQEIRQARKELAEQQDRESAQAQAGHVDSGLQELSSAFQKKAKGFLWYEGTGNDDPIMAHQWQAVQFGAVAKRWICGDGIGLGKSREAIGWLDLIDSKRVLVIAEAGICNQFAGEIMEVAPHRNLVNIYKKTPEKRHEMLDDAVSRDESIIVVNFEIWRKDKEVLRKLLEWGIDSIIVDEAHNMKSISTSNFKNIKLLVLADNTCPKCSGRIVGLWEPEGLAHVPKRYKAKPCPRCGWKKGNNTGVEYETLLDEELSTKSVKNLCLTTGTPILNDPKDLYALLHLCDPTLFRTQSKFIETYCINNYHSNKMEFRGGALQNLKPLIRGRFIQRSAKDAGIHLPKQRIHIVPVEMDKIAYAKQYRTIRQITDAAQIILDTGEAMTIMHLISLVLRKRQANVWPGGIVMKDKFGNVLFDAGTEIDESIKLDAIQENVLQLHKEGHRQVVFSQFATGIRVFEKRLAKKGIRVAVLDGKTTESHRDAIKANFYRNKKEEALWDVVLVNYKTGGTGLNLTAATATHILDEEWNPGKRNQAYGRTDRIGQTEENDVYVYRIPGTIDVWMSNTIKRKEAMIEQFDSTVNERDPLSAESLLEAMRTGEVL